MAASFALDHDHGFFSYGDRCGIFNSDEHGTLVVANTWMKGPGTKKRNDPSFNERASSGRSADGATTNTCLARRNEPNPFIGSYHLSSRHACSAEDERLRISQPQTKDGLSSSAHVRSWIRRAESKVPSDGNHRSHRKIIEWWSSLYHPTT